MKVLGIESSCDETAAAVVTEAGDVLSDVVASQINEHAPYGGVVPELASRAHMRAIVPVINQALAGVPGGLDDVEAIAYTQGPGLIGALLVGVQMAKAMSYVLGIPCVGVDHLQGHLFAPFLRRKGEGALTKPSFPFVALLVSGGHTALYEVHSIGRINLLGQTRDDAAGEAYDKVAKLLGLGYPGGPIIDKLAQKGDPNALQLPRPMASTKHFEFSFSGLKTAMVQHIQQHGLPDQEQQLQDVCASFQQAVVDVLVGKSMAAVRSTGWPRLVLTGGVAANQGLRDAAAKACRAAGAELFVPPIASCTDNAAMIAYVGALQLAEGRYSSLDATAYSRSVLNVFGAPTGALSSKQL